MNKFVITLAVLFGIVILQNMQTVGVQFLFWEARLPLLFLFIIVLAVGVGLGYFWGKKH